VKGVKIALTIIDALAAGFDLVRRRLWLILVPVVLDLFLWLGPRISIGPLVQRITPLLSPPATTALSTADAQTLALSRDALLEAGRSFNVFSLLTNTLLGVPGLMTVTEPAKPVVTSAVIQVSSGWLALGTFILLLLASVFIATLYLGLIAQEITAGAINLKSLLLGVWIYGARIVALGAFLIGVALILVFPMSIVSALVALVSQGLAIMIIGAFSLAAMWVTLAVLIYLFFAVSAIVLNGDGILPAVRNSITIVRRNMWSTLGLIVLVNLISAGLGLIWQRMAVASWGAQVGILCNSFVGSGLVAAVLIFYRDRYARLQHDVQNAALKPPPRKNFKLPRIR
jgi:hypothetical protein